MSAAPRLEVAPSFAHFAGDALAPRLIDAASRMTPASADELNRASLQRRFDRKFLLPTDAAGPLLELVAHDYHVVLAGEARFAQYDTVYFDTPDLRFYHDHRRRRRPRVKVRIRHYIDRGFSMLEVKQKTVKGDTVKHRWQRESNEMTLTEAEQALVAGAVAPIKLDVALAPQARTRFSRLMLVGTRSIERATLDFELELEHRARRRPVRFVVVEVKDTGRGAQSPLLLALRAAHAKQRSFSKYSVAVASLSDERTTSLRPLVTLVDRGLR
ncbi:MAG: VTC domain-containing protein [Polyangiales bacterium]